MGSALAQTGAGGGPPAIYNLLFFGLLAGIIYFLLIRPEQQRRKEIEQQVAGLKKNDVVVLSCGTFGRVVTLAEKTLGLEIAPNVKIQVDRSAIQRVETAPAAEGREKEREKS